VIVVGLSFLHYSHFNLDTDYSHYAWARALQGLGYAFFFVPLTVITYSQLRPGQNNKASSLTNFFRNWGGNCVYWERQRFSSIDRRANLTASTPAVQQQVRHLAEFFTTRGYSPADAARG
jgi:DHA2 family multidrug resistance protein